MDNDKRTKRNQSKQLTLAVLAALIVVAPFAAANGVPDIVEGEPEVGDPTSIGGSGTSNVLTVDARTGHVTDWDDRGGALTTVRVTHVPSPVMNLTLVQPTGWASFVNQAGGEDGIVEFWEEQLLPGMYAVVRQSGVGYNLVTEFDATPYVTALNDELAEAGIDTNKTGSPLSGWELFSIEQKTPTSHNNQKPYKAQGTAKSDANACASAANRKTLIYSENKWTPMVVVHSPYGGSAEASSSWTSSKTSVKGPYSKTSSKTMTGSLESDSGQTRALFLLAKWGYYSEQKGSEGGCSGSRPIYYFQVASWSPNGFEKKKTFYMFGSSTTTDSDDAISVSDEGYDSLVINHRYSTKNAVISTTGGGVSFNVASGTYTSVSGTVEVAGKYASVSISLSATSGSTTAFTYNFPARSSGCWYTDYLGSSKYDGWAFKWVSSSSSC